MEIIEKKLCDRENSEFTIKKYNMNICGNGGIRNGVTGINFEIKYKNLQVDRFWGWIGIYYDRPNPSVCMGFYDNPGWGRNYIELVKPFQSNWHSESTFSKPYFDSTCLWFDMNQTLHDKFDNSNKEHNEWFRESYDIWIKMLKYAVDNNKSIIFG